MQYFIIKTDKAYNIDFLYEMRTIVLKETGQVRSKSTGRIIVSLAINLLVPVLLYNVLRYFHMNNSIALAMASCIPALRTIILFALRRRVDFIGVLSVFGFLCACMLTIITGENSLIIKLYHPIISLVIGFALLTSVAIKKPLFLVIIKKYKRLESNQLEDEKIKTRINLVTAIIGFTLICDAVAHIIIVVTLQTGTYMIVSRVITITILIIIYITFKTIRRNYSGNA